MKRRDYAAIGAMALILTWSGVALAQGKIAPSSEVTGGPFNPVTYGDVLAHPDDLDINYRWARTQIARGDLKGASATLERMLLVNPDQPGMRFLYGVVLYRLGSYPEAAEQLHQLDKVAMEPGARAEIDGYLAQVEAQMRGTRYNTLLAFGIQWDSNRNFSPGNAVGAATPPSLFTGPEVSDFALIGVAGFGMRQDLGYQGQAELTADAAVYSDSQFRVRSLDLLAGQGRLGAVLRTDWATLTPNFIVSGIGLGSAYQPYYGALGGDLRVDKTLDQFDRKLSVYGDILALSETFNKVSLDPTADQSSGAHYQLELGGTYRIADNLSATLAWQGTVKEAKIPGRAYNGNNVVLAANWAFAPGQFLQGVIQYGDFPYRGIDPTVDPLHKRRDDIFDARLTYGIGVETLFATRGPSDMFRDLVFTVGVEDIHDSSTVATYRSNDVRVLTMLTKKFEF